MLKHLGDITKINGASAPRVEVVIGGSPCQDLSVAGKRAGLAGERSGLFMEQIRIIKEMREHDERDGRTNSDVFPRWMVCENVPGALSSNGGEDFRAVLEETVRVEEQGAAVPRYEGGSWRPSGALMGDGWSVAWRVHDAQYWGVPQRRRRICLVADFAGGTAPWIVFDTLGGDAVGGCPLLAVGHSGGGSGPEVRFIAEGLSRDPAPGGAAGERAAGDSAGGFGASGWALNPWYTQTSRIFPADGVYHTLNSRDKSGLGRSGELAFKPGNGDKAWGIELEEELSPTLNAECGGNNPAICIQGNVVDRDAGQNGMGISEDQAPTLNATDRHAVFDARGNGDGTVCPTITGDHENRVTDYTAVCVGNGQTNNISMSEFGNTLDTMHAAQAVMARSVVRRLTPLECERLQGYPDGWTDIGDWVDSKGKKRTTSDAARYKALGNSIALPYWRWMLGRLIRHCRVGTMASLFDGIGGFPLCWHSVGGETLWASEIEEFPMAVTKRRFGED